MSNCPDEYLGFLTWLFGLMSTLSGATYFNKNPIYAIFLFIIGIICNMTVKVFVDTDVKNKIYWVYIAFLYLFCIFMILTPID